MATCLPPRPESAATNSASASGAGLPAFMSASPLGPYAISTSDTVDHSVIRMIVSDWRKALLLFEEHGTLVVETEVLMIEGSNKPGSLAALAHKLARGKVNIEYAYCATPPNAKKGLLVLRVNDAKKALKALNT